MQPVNSIAFDRSSVRTLDADGRLHVAVSNISREQVADYYGREIPGWQELGLDADRVYGVYRPAAELERAAATFNNVPLLSQHVPVTAFDHRPELVVGSTGTDGAFEPPYLRNSLVVWSQDAINAINKEEARELSCAYRYKPVLESGAFDGKPYQLRMTDLVANHVALVKQGRAGPDVVVGDSKPKELHMKHKAPSRLALLARGALMALDAKLDVATLTKGVTRANWKERKPQIVAAIKPTLAQDADLESVVNLLDALEAQPEAVEPGEQSARLDAVDNAAAGGEGETPAASSDTPADALMNVLRGKLSAEDLAAIEPLIAALCAPAGAAQDADDFPPKTEGTPNPPEKEGDKLDKPAMDAALAKVRKEAAEDGMKLARAITEAERVVRPYVGDLAIACDSAEGVFKTALDLLGVKTEGIHPSAYRAVLEAQTKPSDKPAPRVAMDAAATKSFNDRFPGLSKVRVLN